MPADAFSRMDSSGSGSDGSGAEGLSTSPGGSSLRERTDSENSEKQQKFVIPGGAGSPPKIVSMDEIMGVVKNIEDMTLAHEIAINPDFKLTRYEPPDNSLEKRVKEMMTRAYWELLKEQLNRTPPCFDHAISLLAEIKVWLKDVISRKNQRALEQIYEVLDEMVIRKQAEQGVLDFRAYADFVIQIMAKSCAPIRDKEIEDLSNVEDVVETFKRIMEILSVMKLDMANTLLSIARNDVVSNSIEYEKKKFKEYLNYYKDGFPATEDWLKRNKPNLDVAATSNGTTTSPIPPQQPQTSSESTIVNAYMELLEYSEEKEFPELLNMDKDRFLTMKSKAERLCACASTMAVASGVPVLGQNSDFKNSLSRQIEIILQNVNNQKELEDTLMNVWLHLKSVITSRLKEMNFPELDESTEDTLKNHILQISNKDSPVRSLLWKRLMNYLKVILRNKNFPPAPPGYVDFGDEVESISVSFKRLTSYNYSVYSEFYQEILANSST